MRSRTERLETARREQPRELPVVAGMDLEQRGVGIAVQAKRVGEGRLGLRAAVPSFHDGLPERRSAEGQQAAFDLAMTPSPLQGNRRGVPEELERPSMSLEESDHRPLVAGPLADRERL